MRTTSEDHASPLHTIVPGLFGVFLAAAVAAFISPGAQAAESPGAAARRLLTVLEAAASAEPVAAQTARLDAEAAELRAGSAAGNPAVSWQQEGLDLSLGEQPNAAGYLRWSSPFHYPWQLGRVRRFDAGVQRWLGDAMVAARAEQVRAAGSAWLELATAIEREDVARRRLEWLDQALRIQQKRLEVGEVSGSEVIQLELERAQDAALLAAARTQRRVLTSEITNLIGAGFLSPELGDLDHLTAATAPGRPVAAPEAAVAASPWLVEAASRAERERRNRELAHRLAWGRPAFEVEWEHVPEIDGLEGFDAVGFAVSVPLPLGKEGRQRKARAASVADAAATDLAIARRALTQRARLAQAAADEQSALLAELASVRRRLPDAEHSLSEQFRLGAISYLILIDGLSRLDQVRLRAVEASRDLLAARLELALLLADPSRFPVPASVLPDVVSPAADPVSNP